ncbi:MAG TPA: hypothetical protein VMF08_02865 [Candidatus Sulfotelmatobacter sp.]|nr:hypothetical protein [Candidatus Sulfotelmatobacter sp.]
MNELAAFILPPATALAGMRLVGWLLGEKFEMQFDFGFRFALGLAFGMLVFSQAILLSALAGFNASLILAWLAIFWGVVELAVIPVKLRASWKPIQFRPAHWWLLLLLPLAYYWWVYARLSTLEGTLEFDANAFWVFKAKILFLEQGKQLIHTLRDVNLGYAHMDYPMLVPCLYTFDYGVVGCVDEFINKVWPFWMMVALSAGFFSVARLWKHPHPLPIAAFTLVAFLPASLEFIRNEGGTVPMVFYTSIAVLLIVAALCTENDLAPAALVLVLAGCFSTKFEGSVFAAVTICALAPFALRHKWLRNRALHNSAAAAVICALPYLFYRLTGPVTHPESVWLHRGMAAPDSLLHRFPQVWFLDVFARFFSPDIFRWQSDNGHLHWVGKWAGPGSLVNDQLAVLPWLAVVLFVLSIIYKCRGRLVVGLLSAIVLAIFTFLSFVVACLHTNDLQSAIDFACNIVGRYYFPFFIAWFLGTTAIWLIEEKKPGAVGAEKLSSATMAQGKGSG